MAEYKSFHYLMHQVPDAIKPVYVTGPVPLPFNELYTPRVGAEAEKPKLIYKGEKSFWRTRDRIEFSIYENRSTSTMIITSTNIETKDAYRTIFLNLELLYFELEAKARGDRLPLTKKKDRKLDEALLHKSATDYILSRLMIGAEAIAWPQFDDITNLNSLQPIINTQSNTSIASVVNGDDNDIKPTIPCERMCTFQKMSGDMSNLEINVPKNFRIDCMDSIALKLHPTSPSIIPVINMAASTLNDDKIVITATEVDISSIEGTILPNNVKLTHSTKQKGKDAENNKIVSKIGAKHAKGSLKKI